MTTKRIDNVGKQRPPEGSGWVPYEMRSELYKNIQDATVIITATHNPLEPSNLNILLSQKCYQLLFADKTPAEQSKVIDQFCGVLKPVIAETLEIAKSNVDETSAPRIAKNTVTQVMRRELDDKLQWLSSAEREELFRRFREAEAKGEPTLVVDLGQLSQTKAGGSEKRNYIVGHLEVVERSVIATQYEPPEQQAIDELCGTLDATLNQLQELVIGDDFRGFLLGFALRRLKLYVGIIAELEYPTEIVQAAMTSLKTKEKIWQDLVKDVMTRQIADVKAECAALLTSRGAE